MINLNEVFLISYVYLYQVLYILFVFHCEMGSFLRCSSCTCLRTLSLGTFLIRAPYFSREWQDIISHAKVVHYYKTHFLAWHSYPALHLKQYTKVHKYIFQKTNKLLLIYPKWMTLKALFEWLYIQLQSDKNFLKHKSLLRVLEKLWSLLRVPPPPFLYGCQ